MQSEETNPLLELDNKKIGKKLYIHRKIAGLKAFDVAERLGLKEAAYTKYERGETNFTVEFVQKIANIFEVDPMKFLSSYDGYNIENSNSPNSVVTLNSSNWQTTNEKQNEAILKLIDNVVEMNKRVMELLEKSNIK